MEEQIAAEITAERVRRVAQGFTDAKGRKVPGLGGGFQFCRLSDEPLFSDLTEEQKNELLKDADGTLPFSLANALRLRRPFVIVDEAHNSRTELAFDTLAKFKPAGIMELTATPDTQKTPSNVLHAVSAVELKREQMIKLPIELEVEPDEQRCLALAIDQREQLNQAAIQEQRKGRSYIRPLVLIQSEPKSRNRETRHAEWVKNELMTNQNIPEEEIVIATGSERGLEALEEKYAGGIFSEKCPVKFVITQKALAEGWDCAFAYVLVSMAGIRSATAEEQLLGRILRQPRAEHRTTEALNRSYAFVVSHDFGETAAALRDSLVKTAGFNRHDAAEFVAALKPEQARLDLSRGRIRFTPVEVKVSEELNLSAISRPTRRKLNWNKKSKTLMFTAPLSEASFFLQTATRKFYPDFVCKLKDGRILIVEYKGADRWKNAEPDRLVGQLWEELSDGSGLFVMITEKRWGDIRAKF
ncbi:hypothetical protein EGM51_13540 [Verrucomicrobia bacterium S94]|nr:hypothetical protein EGM51_13540 [Verrucomicrobia bacterium S94]